MPKFAVEKINEIDGYVLFYALRVDNRCAFDEFCTQIRQEGTYSKELNTIQTRMQEISERKTLPVTKFRPLGNKEYEIKTKHLRVYLFQEEQTGKIIVCAGKKTTQRKDIKHFRLLKAAYLNSKLS